MAQKDRAIVKNDAVDSSDSQAPAALTARLHKALNGRSPAWLAKASGVKDATVRKYLAGGQPTVIPAVKLANALGVRLAWLLTGEGSMTGAEVTQAKGADLFDASEADWVFLPYYRFASELTFFQAIPVETYPVRRDALRRSLGVESGLWVTAMPNGLPGIAEEGDTIVCRNATFAEPGHAYLLGVDGNLVARRFGPAGFYVDDPSEPILGRQEAQLAGVFPVGEILARFGLSPIRPRA